MTYKEQFNYREQIADGDSVAPIYTCQDCIFSVHNKFCQTNELHCENGNVTVSVNGICDNFLDIFAQD